ncbi:glycosyltransferase involved in cell wall biosynthesis [Nocardioides albertanoniae]|uniref:4,4'-diaponeurosporenoate glycosyltransferase n=1 Tax=Nocardioides albertanoniae TaxID=1175486 RepID=A0A543ABJ4_9ACTN|nr:glycosyltransferase [Nocardioides albertanoniae]TQL69971.1 glycosyltransferase involved in cell wall biosynthesis [Nocardioides albertanoniae]
MTRARASVVIPAHDEAAGIGRLLHRLLDTAEPGELEVVVAANASTDATVSVTSGFAGVTVLDLPVASKVAALNAADEVATVFPRIYLDADIDLTLDSLRLVVDELSGGTPAAAPAIVVDTRGCGPGVRAYYAIWSRLGYARHHLLGAGVYGLSEAGRARFGRFPDVLNDDQFVYDHFRHDERVNPPGSTFTVRAPRTLRAVYRRGTRIALGNLQLRTLGRPVTAPGPTWRGVLLAEPWLAPAVAAYVAMKVLMRTAAARRLRSGSFGDWGRDDSSRVAP